MRIVQLGILASLVAIIGLTSVAPAADYYVDPSGSGGAFQTLAAARDAIRRAKQDGSLPKGPVVIDIAPGSYPLTESLSFSKADSGTADAPIIYRASRGDVHVIGGKSVTGFRPVRDAKVRERLSDAARDVVVELHLPSAGVTDFGHIATSGFSRKDPLAHLELFAGGAPLHLAQWPNDRWEEIASVPKGEKIIDSSGKPRGTNIDRFHYSGDRPRRWKSLDDVWVHGYWFVDWADQYIQVADIDRDARSVIMRPPQSNYGYKKGQRFRFLNVLEELDTPGEYYLDRTSGMLYAWLPEGADPSTAFVSILAEPLVKLHDVSNVQFVGLTLEYGRSDGIVIEGGHDVLLAGCKIRNLAGSAVRVVGGKNHRVQSCDLYNLGGGGIYLTGGDRQTLTPGGHVAENNHIHHYSRWVRTYRLAISLSGVGLRAGHNSIHDAPHSGISYNGNDHLIEYNELYNLCQDTGDVGGIYTGRDWAARGTVLQYNHIHHLGGVNMGSNAIYLDDLCSGQTIRGNVIHDVWRAMMIGGGRDNVVEDNVFHDYKIGIHFDSRGIGWSRKLIEGRQGAWDMYGRLETVPYKDPPYATKYPRLPNILNEKPLEPMNNRIAKNTFSGEPWLDPRGFTQEHAEEQGWLKLEANTFDETPNPSKNIPMSQIGLQADEYRQP